MTDKALSSLTTGGILETGDTGWTLYTVIGGNSRRIQRGDIHRLANAEWITSYDAAGTSELNMFRANSSDYTEWSNPLYYDDNSSFTSRDAKLIISANTASPSSLSYGAFILHQGKGDNATFIGVGGIYCQARDRTDVSSSNKGVLYGVQIDVNPTITRNNSPYDDVVGLAIANSGSVSGTEAIYVGAGSAGFASGVALDCDASYGFRASGSYTNGLDFVSGGPATFSGSAILLPNATKFSARNAADSANLELLKLDSSNILQIGADVSSVASVQTWNISSTTSNVSNLTLTCTSADASPGPLFKLYRNSASPATADTLGMIAFHGNDSASNDTSYAEIRTYIADVTNPAEDGALQFLTTVNASITEQMVIQSGVKIGNPTGGVKGAGTLNVSAGLYVNNIALLNGSGDPNTSVSAAKGSLYMRTDGSSTSTRAYINTDGSTAWTAVTTAT